MEKKLLNFSPIQVCKDISPTKINSENIALDIFNLRFTNPDQVEGNTLVWSNDILPDQISNILVADSFNIGNTSYKAGETFNFKDVELSICNITSCTLNKLAVFCKDSKNQIFVFTIVQSTTRNLNGGSTTVYKINLVYNKEGIFLGKDIKAVFQYESEQLQKLYWIDDINQPRVINIASTKYKDAPCDFVPQLPSKGINFSVEEIPNGGLWEAGCVKYLISLCVPYIVESNIAASSSLFFTNKNGWGLSPEGTIKATSSYKITLPSIYVNNALDESYTHCRVYRIMYTSQNYPVAYDLGYYKLVKDTSVEIIDTGSLNSNASTVDVTSIRFRGVTPIIGVQSLETKDNHLLFGGYTTLDNYINTANSFLKYEKETLFNETTHTLFNTSIDKLTLFHKKENYRFGIQYMNKWGVWSNIVNTDHRIFSNNINEVFYTTTKPNDEIIAARLVCSYPIEGKRNFIAQGLEGNTLFYSLNKTYSSDYLLSNFNSLGDTELSYNCNDNYVDDDTLYSNESAIIRTNTAKVFYTPDLDSHFKDTIINDVAYIKIPDYSTKISSIDYAINLDISNPLVTLQEYYIKSINNLHTYTIDENHNSFVPGLTISLPVYMGNSNNNIPVYSYKDSEGNKKYVFGDFLLPLWSHEGCLNNATNSSPSTLSVNVSKGEVDTEAITTSSMDAQYKLNKKEISRNIHLRKGEESSISGDDSAYTYKCKFINNEGNYSLREGDENTKAIYYWNNPRMIFNSVGAYKKLYKIQEYSSSNSVYYNNYLTNYFKFSEKIPTLKIPSTNQSIPESDPAYESKISGAMNISYKNENHLVFYNEKELKEDISLSYDVENDVPFLITVTGLTNGKKSTKNHSTLDVNMSKVSTKVTSDTIRGDFWVYTEKTNNISIMAYLYDTNTPYNDNITYFSPYYLRYFSPHDTRKSDNYCYPGFNIGMNGHLSGNLGYLGIAFNHPMLSYMVTDDSKKIYGGTTGNIVLGIDSILAAHHPSFKINISSPFITFNNFINSASASGNLFTFNSCAVGKYLTSGTYLEEGKDIVVGTTSQSVGYEGDSYHKNSISSSDINQGYKFAGGTNYSGVNLNISQDSYMSILNYASKHLNTLSPYATSYHNSKWPKEFKSTESTLFTLNSTNTLDSASSLASVEITDAKIEEIITDSNAQSFINWLNTPLNIMMLYKGYTPEDTSYHNCVRFLGRYTPWALMVEFYRYYQEYKKGEDPNEKASILNRWWASKKSSKYGAINYASSGDADTIQALGKKYYFFPKNELSEHTPDGSTSYEDINSYTTIQDTTSTLPSIEYKFLDKNNLPDWLEETSSTNTPYMPKALHTVLINSSNITGEDTITTNVLKSLLSDIVLGKLGSADLMARNTGSIDFAMGISFYPLFRGYVNKNNTSQNQFLAFLNSLNQKKTLPYFFIAPYNGNSNKITADEILNNSSVLYHSNLEYNYTSNILNMTSWKGINKEYNFNFINNYSIQEVMEGYDNTNSLDDIINNKIIDTLENGTTKYTVQDLIPTDRMGHTVWKFLLPHKSQNGREWLFLQSVKNVVTSDTTITLNFQSGISHGNYIITPNYSTNLDYQELEPVNINVYRQKIRVDYDENDTPLGTVSAGPNNLKLIIAADNNTFKDNLNKISTCYQDNSVVNNSGFKFGYYDGISSDMYVWRHSYFVSPTTSNINTADQVDIQVKSIYKKSYFKDEEIKSLISEEQPHNITWYPCSETYYFGEKDSIELTANQGDCYYTPYSLLMSYPYTDKQTNQLVEIYNIDLISHINTLGRYDTRRNLKDHTQSRPENFNLFNNVYNQKDNFFSAFYSEEDDLIEKSFPCQITYSLNKIAGSKEDTWTLTNPATGFYDADGSLGAIKNLHNYKGNLYCMQESGISLVSFNARVQIPVSDGVPIEMSNSGKLDAIINVSNNYGILNYKNSKVSEGGIYFIDSKTHHLCLLSENKIQDISQATYNNSWFKQKDLNLFYDSLNNSLYCNSSLDSFVYDILNQKFIGRFDSYYKLTDIVPFNYNMIGYDTNDLYVLYKGDYASNFSITLAALTPKFILNSFLFSSNDVGEFNLQNHDITSIIDKHLYQEGDIKPFETMTISNDYQELVADTTYLNKDSRIWTWSMPRGIRKAKMSTKPWDNYNIFKLQQSNYEGFIRFYNFALSYYA